MPALSILVTKQRLVIFVTGDLSYYLCRLVLSIVRSCCYLWLFSKRGAN